MRRREFIAALSTSWQFYCTVRVALAGADIPKMAFFGFQLINTSVAPTTPEEEQRIRMLDGLFRQELAASGRFEIVSISHDLGQEIASGPGIINCNGCQRDYARRAGADWAASAGTVPRPGRGAWRSRSWVRVIGA
jgi:hypothetical protein